MTLMLTHSLQTTAFKQLWLTLTGVLLIASALGLRGCGKRLHEGAAAGFRTGKAESLKAEVASEMSHRAGVKSESVTSSAVSFQDSDYDGIPDVAELSSFSDRENFRRWFTAIAETQFYTLSGEWSAEQRDCAGLVRFAWREALRRHDRQWFRRMGRGYESLAPDVGSYTLESSPLGEKLFRTNSAAFKEDDLETGAFSEFADARHLKDFNSTYIGRDRRRAQPGDLLVFFQPWVQKLPLHLMIFLGQASTGRVKGARDWVVYHTGASARDAGTVKKVRLSVLNRHPDRRWRPLETNPNFLGFYRLKILD
jgi:uncharacterized protein